MLQVISHLGMGGAERVCFELIRGLSAETSFAVYAPLGVGAEPVGEAMEAELRALGVPLHVGPAVRFKRGGLAFGALCFPVGTRPDVIHVHTEVPEAALATARWLKASLRGVPVVRTIHNSVYWPAHRTVGRWCARALADAHVAAVSAPALAAFEALREEASAKEPRSARVIPNGVRVVRTARTVGGRGRVRLLYAARLERQKGADLLPSIVRAARLPAGTHVELQIHGAGTEAQTLRAFAAAPPAGWTIRVDAPVADLAARLGDFDLLVMPSRFEGLSVLAMESLASGLPIVGTGALREGLPADYPWCAPPGDAAAFAELLTRVLAAPQTWDAVAAAAQTFAREHFTADAMCAAYGELYAQALHAARMPAAAWS